LLSWTVEYLGDDEEPLDMLNTEPEIIEAESAADAIAAYNEKMGSVLGEFANERYRVGVICQQQTYTYNADLHEFSSDV
jgi:hypothetical protein